jgi:hypothetical protein
LLTVLQAQQTLFTAKNQLIQVKLSHLQAEVGLYQSLGGGWVEASDDATQKTTADGHTLLATPQPATTPAQPQSADPSPAQPAKQ